MCMFIDITTKYVVLWCCNVVVWLNGRCMVMGLVVGGGSNSVAFKCFFSSFSDYLSPKSVLISLSARIISLWGVATTGPGMCQGTGFTAPVLVIQSVILVQILVQ